MSSSVWFLDHNGTEALAYTRRRDGALIRVRNGDLSDIGVFADVGAAIRFGQEQAPLKVPVSASLS